MKRRILLFVTPLVAVLLFAPVLGHELLYWDDMAYVGRNPLLDDPGAAQILEILDTSTRTLGAWTPMTLISYAVEGRLAGRSAAVFHGTNVLLHATAALGVALLLARLGLGPVGAAAGALFFAVHPLQVEPVAWISGRKDLLAGVLSLGAVLLYLVGRRPARTAALLLFLTALGAKSSAVVVPLLLVAIHAAFRRRIAPGEAAILLLMTVFAGLRGLLEVETQAGASAGAAALGPGPRAAAMIGVCVRYVRRWVLPYDMAAAYPVTAPDVATGLAFVGLAVLGVVAWRASRERPPLRTGLLWWPLALLPVLNVWPAPHLEADRYQYLALVGPALWLGYALDRATAPERARWSSLSALLLCALFLGGLSIRSRVLLYDWRDSATFFGVQIERFPEWWIGRLASAVWHLDAGRLDRAEAEARAVRSSVPDLARAPHVLGLVAAARGDREAALRLQEEALRLEPGLTPALANRCTLLGSLGRLEGAVSACAAALVQDRHQPRVRHALALAYVALGNRSDEAGRIDRALQFYDWALANAPDLPDAHYNRAVALHRSGRLEQAVADYRAAAELKPENVDAWTHLGTLQRRLGRADAARDAYERALAVDPARVEARYGLAILLVVGGELRAAREELLRVLALDPDLGEAQRALAQVDAALALQAEPTPGAER